MNEALVLPMSAVALCLLAAFVLDGMIGLERKRHILVQLVSGGA